MQDCAVVDLAQVDAIIHRYPPDESSLVMVLQDVQAAFNFLPCEALDRVAEQLHVPHASVFSVATFYKVFCLQPQGRTVIHVCKGTACHVRGAQLIEDELCRQLQIGVDQTTPDGAFTIRTVNCVGACAMAPVVITGERYHGEVQPARIGKLLRQADGAPRGAPSPPREQPADLPHLDTPAALVAWATDLARTRAHLGLRVQVCGGPGCLAAGAREVHGALREAAAGADLPLRLTLERCAGDDRLLSLTGCQGLCQQGPLVHIRGGEHSSPAVEHKQDLLYTHVKPADAARIVESIGRGGVVQDLLGEHPGRAGHPFYEHQQFLALSTCGEVDPESLADCLASGGFGALARAVSETAPEQILDAVDRSGLRGRGGAGFHTARKWRTALRASRGSLARSAEASAQTQGASRGSGRAPYILCNGDEGDPGAFMDRAIMEGSPYQVIEGMILGALALHAEQGYIYVRAEYPLAVQRLQRALDTCRKVGLLGRQILGSSLDFDIRISRGGGAFVCGESTALMRSIEGKVGEPRAKYVRSAERGLYDAPTVLNNVETWALVPGIVRDGPESFAATGTERSRGTKAFSLTGQVQRTGLVEVPMGTTLRRLIFDIGGGVRPGRTFKAVQTGGPSGGCLPQSELDLPVDFEALAGAGSMMGSGGMIVMDDRTCMVDVARYFVDFLLQESCGKCTACRLGLPQLSRLLARVTHGTGEPGDLDAIHDVARTMTDCSLCGLGKSASNPVLSTLQYFRAEYEAHLAGRCPAGVCRDLIHYEINHACTGCLLCIKPCPTSAITGVKQQRHIIDAQLCTRCGICRSVCQYDAVDVLSPGVHA